MRSALMDARDVLDDVVAAAELLSKACAVGEEAHGRYSPSFRERNRALAEAAAHLVEAKSAVSALRKSLDTLVPVVTFVAAQLEVQTSPSSPSA